MNIGTGVIPRWGALCGGLDRSADGGHSAARHALARGLEMLRLEMRVSGFRTNNAYTMLRTWLRGELAGEDEHGNRYYRERKRRDTDWRQERRWVVFAKVAEPTEVPPGWFGWLHKRIELPPSKVELPAPRWEQERLPNLTGTNDAYLPPGALQRGGQRAPSTGDYEAWRPE